MASVEGPRTPLTGDGHYRLLVDAITDYAVYMLDPSGVVVSWNPGARRFKGYDAHEIIGQHFSRFYTEEDRRGGLPARALATAAKEGRFEAEGWRLRKDKTRFWAHVVIDPIRDDAGSIIGFAKITRDLTERKLAADNLKQSEQQFRLLIEGVTDYAIYMLDPEGRITNWNAGAQKIKGYLPEEIIGQNFSRFYTEEDRQRGDPQRGLETAAREGRFEREGLRVRKDGSRFWASVIIDAIRDDKGKLIGFAKVTRDITERRNAQRELDQAREAVVQSQKMEAIGRLTGGIAHDFNNLLMAILGSLELLRKRLPDDTRITPLLNNAIQGAERGASLTHRMLAFARRQELDPQPVDVRSLVSGMDALLQQSVGPAVMIDTRFPLTMPPARTDSAQLEAALLNLAVNARDAMPKGGRLTIAAREESIAQGPAAVLKPGRYLVISVADNGEGMNEETARRAAEPFFTTKGVGKGTGLGLSMVQGLAEQSGGRLTLKSKVGEGTTAELWFPVAQDGAEKQTAAAAAVESSTAVRPLVVLAVDDDALVLMNTAAMLEDLGHKVFEASSGREALEILRREKSINLVVTDQSMPRMTGLELAETIMAARPELPIVLATGYTDLPEGARAGLPKLTKPFFQQDLAQAIAEALKAPPAKGRILKFTRTER
ncbi:MAG: PAS domain S-box protein [Pseudolabrys sp.]